MKPRMDSLGPGQVSIGAGLFHDRFELNRRYVLSLHSDALLQSFYQEAGLLGKILGGADDQGGHMHWGWEAPTCQVRGHFLGHWLSAAARIYAATGDDEVKVKADHVVAELARCQKANGGEWVGSIPEKYLQWIAGQLPKQRIWAPHYTLHKTLMGLIDMHRWAGSKLALDILDGFAAWFHRWTNGFTREQMDDILDFETGGMLEAWADLYGFTGKQEHLDLIERYDRPRLFDRLLAGLDPLTNAHANTTIPEAQGAARAYEVTGDERWRKIAEAYWRCAVTERGEFATGSQTCGEVWTPPHEFAARLGDKNQEHCVVYNMIRLAHYLLRWTGDATYADYIERSIWNGILAQQNPRTGMVTYFLPLEPGGVKSWGDPTHDFWCCHGTLVQAHSAYPEWTWLADAEGPVLSQYIPSTARWTASNGTQVRLTVSSTPTRGSFDQNESPQGQTRRPDYLWFEVAVDCDYPVEFPLRLRLPGWLAGPARVTVNGKPVEVTGAPGSFFAIRRKWVGDVVHIRLPKHLRAVPIPDEPSTVAFVDGPILLAGLCDEERALVGDPSAPETMLQPDNEREWGYWLHGYRAVGQDRGLRFRPLYTVADERYTVYFPVHSPKQ